MMSEYGYGLGTAATDAQISTLFGGSTSVSVAGGSKLTIAAAKY